MWLFGRCALRGWRGVGGARLGGGAGRPVKVSGDDGEGGRRYARKKESQ